MKAWMRLAEAIAAEGSAALVSVVAVEGSSPRDAGARLVVRPSGAFHGTIGGGALEWDAIAEARRLLEQGRGPAFSKAQLLGPDLAQCCGGRVHLRTETFDARDADTVARWAAREGSEAFDTVGRLDADGRVFRDLASGPVIMAGARDFLEHWGEVQTPLLLFGAGHVGRALVLALAPLPFAVRWIDTRPDAFPKAVPQNCTFVRAADMAAEVTAAPLGAFALVMTHSHALDLDVTAAALRSDRFAAVGLIGSHTKRARFVSQMRALGLDADALARFVCPIGIAGIEGKEPEIIAAATAAQLLQWRESGGV